MFETCLECLNNLQSAANDDMAALMDFIIKIYPDSNKLLKKMEDAAL